MLRRKIMVLKWSQIRNLFSINASSFCFSYLSKICSLFSFIWLWKSLINVNFNIFRHSGKPVIFLFIYCLIINLIISAKLIGNQNAATQTAFFITGALYGIISEAPFYNPTQSRIFSVLLLALIWTSGLIWLTPILSELLYGNNIGEQLFWYWLGYSLPIIVMLGYVKSGNIGRGFNWKELFVTEQKTDLKQLYLQTTQLARFMEILRKS